MKRLGSIRRKTRSKYSKHYRDKGKVRITRFIKSFNTGDRVALTVESAYAKGNYHPRFFGKVGRIKSKKGNCYEVDLTEFNKPKTLLVHPVHLKKV